MKFRAAIIPSGNATGVEVPEDVMRSLGPEARPPVAVSINGHTWRSRVALMRGQRLIGISAANRAAAGIGEGDFVEVDIQPDRQPREVPLPSDVAEALNEAALSRAAFDGLPYGLKRKYVTEIEEAKSPDVRRRRIAKLVAALSGARIR